MSRVKLAVTVPTTSAEAVRRVAGDYGAGKFGNYSHASFSIKGVGRFLPHEGASLAIGSIGILESVEEERIEWTCEEEDVETIIKEIRKMHPYEAPVIDVYRLEAI